MVSYSNRSFAQDVSYNRDVQAVKGAVREIQNRVDDIVRTYGSPSRHTGTSRCRAFGPIRDMMAGLGFAYSGSGHFAAVWTRGDAAIKIGLKKEDSGATYAAWARANKGKPGVPAIHALSRGYFCYVVVMDRLHKFDERGADPHTRAEYECIYDALKTGRRDYASRFPTVNTAADIHEFFVGLAEFDLHPGNVMLHYGNLIITDPVSYCGIAANDNVRKDTPPAPAGAMAVPDPAMLDVAFMQPWQDMLIKNMRPQSLWIDEIAPMCEPPVPRPQRAGKGKPPRHHDHLIMRANPVFRIQDVA